jgi:hypothetical protein
MMLLSACNRQTFPEIASLESNWCLQAKSVIQLALRAESGIRTQRRACVHQLSGYTGIIAGRVRES